MTTDRLILLGRPGRMLRLAAFAILLFAVFAVALAIEGYRSQVDQAVNDASLRARGAAADVDRYVQSRWAALYPVAQVPAVRSGDVAAIRAYFDGLDAAAMGLDAGIGYIDLQAQQLARTGHYTGPAIDFRDRSHVQRALATGRPVVSSAFVGTVNASPLIAFVVPVLDDAGRLSGLIGGGIRLDNAHIGSDSLRFAGGTAVVIVDALGQVIAGDTPIRSLVPADPAFRLQELRLAGQGGIGSATGPDGHPDRLLGFASAPAAGWLVLVDSPADEAFAPARLALGAQAAVVLAAAAIALLLLIWAGRRLDAAADAERRTLAKLEDAVGKLEHRQALHHAFVGVMSHELRTPVTTIYGVVKLLAKQPRRPDLESLLADVEEEADRLQRITEDLLVLSRAEHGIVEVRPEPVLLQRLAGTVTADVARRFPGARIDHDIPPGLPPLAADPGALRQVLDNLLANAAKYGGGAPILLRAVASESRVRVEVLDSGPGLPDGEHDRIFELFYRSPVNERRASGTGIGLFVVRQLVEAMGGTVTAEAVHPTGLRFVVDLPADAVQRVPGDDPAPSEEREPAASVAG